MKGVTAYIKQENSEDIRLVFNDVDSTSDSDNPDWKHSVLFAYNNYDKKALKEMTLSKDQYAEIGENLILRLLALNDLIK